MHLANVKPDQCRRWDNPPSKSFGGGFLQGRSQKENTEVFVGPVRGLSRSYQVTRKDEEVRLWRVLGNEVHARPYIPPLVSRFHQMWESESTMYSPYVAYL